MYENQTICRVMRPLLRLYGGEDASYKYIQRDL